MAFPRIQNFPVLIPYLLSIAHAVFLPQPTAQISEGRSFASTGTTTQAPKWSHNDQLQKRQLPGYVCGYSNTFSVTCNDHFQYCQGEILNNGAAYAACVTALGGMPTAIATTGYSYPGSIINPCPPSAVCCPDYIPYVEVDFYIASGYTVTGFDCATAPTTATLIPNPNVLNPAFYSHWFATHVDTTTPPAASSSSDSTAKPQSKSGSSHDSSGGLNESNKIALGVGIGVGLPATIAAIVTCLRRNK